MAAEGCSDDQNDKPSAPFKKLYRINGYTAQPAVVLDASQKRQLLVAGFAALRIHGPGELTVWAADRQKLAAGTDLEENETILAWLAEQQPKAELRDDVRAGQLTQAAADYVNELRPNQGQVPREAPPAGHAQACAPPPMHDVGVAPHDVCARLFACFGSGFDVFHGEAVAAAVRQGGGGGAHEELRSGHGGVPLTADYTVDYTAMAASAGVEDVARGSPPAEGVEGGSVGALQCWDVHAAAAELEETLKGNVWNAWLAEDVSSMQVRRVVGLEGGAGGALSRTCLRVYVLVTERRVYVLEVWAP